MELDGVKGSDTSAYVLLYTLDGGGGSVANVEVLPVPMLSVSNWGLRLCIGNTGSIITQGWLRNC